MLLILLGFTASSCAGDSPGPAEPEEAVSEGGATPEEPAETIDDHIRQNNLTREWSHGIVVDDSMSDELLDALYSYEIYLDRPPREDARPDDLRDRCFRLMPVMDSYIKAPDKEKASAIVDNLEALKRESLDCIEGATSPVTFVLYHYRMFEEGFEDWQVALELQLALHRMDLMSQALEYQITLEDITEYCLDLHGKNRWDDCLAEKLINEVSPAEGYTQEEVRALMKE